MNADAVQTGAALTERVKQVVARSLGLELDEIYLEQRVEDLTEDSIQLFELILAFEKEFEEEAEYEELMEIETVGDIVQYLANRGL